MPPPLPYGGTGALFGYLQQTQRLISDVTNARFNPGDLTAYINTARGHVAGEGECIRGYGSLPVSAATNVYPFSTIAFVPPVVGVAGVINVRMVTYNIASGALRVTAREWEWFNHYVLSMARPAVGPPRYWAQFGQGVNGSLYVSYLDFTYQLNLDTVCYPLPLATNTDPEAVPYYWTDAVPYYAAYLALLSSPSGEKQASEMYRLYQVFVQRARQFATPSALPHQFSQSSDPTTLAKLGVKPADPAQ